MDSNKISVQETLRVADETISKLKLCEDYRFELFGFSIPFFILFLTASFMILNINFDAVPLLVVSCFLSFVTLKTAIRIIYICDIRSHKNVFNGFVKNAAVASRGIQYYSATDFVLNKFYNFESSALTTMKHNLAKCVWKSILSICILFVFICVLYVANTEYIISNLFNISGFETLYFCCVFFFVTFLVSIFRYTNVRNIKLPKVSDCKLDTLNNQFVAKELDNENLFLTFHGVYFQDPTELSDKPILNNVSFSVLPGEFISITGECFVSGSYIFELILKYYSPQSGKIYLSGHQINNIDTKSVRSSVGIFREDFGIVQGTVYDNLAMLINDDNRISVVADSVGLGEGISKEIFCEDGDMAVHQDTLFRIQIARILIQEPKLVLIDTPLYFESDLTENIFYDFIEYISKRNTVIITTNDPKTVIYSDKILYIGIEKSLFGSHAELSQNSDYQNYMKNRNLELSSASSP